MAESTHDDILDAVVSKLQGLNLRGIPSAHIQRGKIASDRENLLPGLPGILVCPFGSAAPSESEGTNLRDDIPYRVIIAIIDAGNQSQTQNAKRMLIWCDTIQKKFRHQRLTGVPSVFKCTIENDIRFDPRMFQKNLDASVVALKFTSRESRG